MPVLYVPAQTQPPAYVQDHVQAESAGFLPASLQSGVALPSPKATTILEAPNSEVRGAVPIRIAQRPSEPLTQPPNSPGSEPVTVVVSDSVPHFHVVPLHEVWTLKAGETISRGLQEWGQRAHWTIVWQLPRDWAVPATTVFSGSFEDAAENVLRTLSTEGVLLKGEIYEGNHTLVVKPTGDKE